MLLGVKPLHPNGHRLHENDIADADENNADIARPVCGDVKSVCGVKALCHAADDKEDEQAADDAQRGGKECDKGHFFIVDNSDKRNGYQYGDNERDTENETWVVKAECVVHPVHDVDKVAVVADKEDAQRQENERKLPVCDKAFEVKGGAELVPERAVLNGLELGVVLEQEERGNSDDYRYYTSNGEKCDIAALRIGTGEVFAVNEHTADKRTYQCTDNGQGCSNRAYLTGVGVIHHVGIPCVVARVVCHRAEKAHDGVGGDDGYANEHDVVVNAVTQIVGHAESNGEDSPEYRAPGDELFA